MLQQHLPFTVLKQIQISFHLVKSSIVATALTVYGIETEERSPTVHSAANLMVATALTVYGIETVTGAQKAMENAKLQQHLPFTVLKQFVGLPSKSQALELLQQHLPFTVLKRKHTLIKKEVVEGCNSTYRLRY